MQIKDAISLLERIAKYSIENNVAESDDQNDAAIVVIFRSLETHLKTYMHEEYHEMLKEFDDLYQFLKMQGSYIAGRDLESKWSYYIMAGRTYAEKKDKQKDRFLPLKRDCDYKYNLFVLLQEPKIVEWCGNYEEYHDLTEKLTDEIQVCYKEGALSEDERLIRKSISDFLNDGIQEKLGDSELTVVQIGSAHTHLSLNEGFLCLGIRMPRDRIKEGALLCDSTNWRNSVYDVHYLAECLRDLGMEATLPIPAAKKTKFTDPVSHIQGSIGIDDTLLFERDLIISEYLKLDSRIRPLIFAIIHFTKSQKINKSRSRSTPTLSSYSYMFMVLHFLMNVAEHPLIPSLQKTFGDCRFSECMYNLNKDPVATFFGNKVQNVDIRYHTCVRILKEEKDDIDKENDTKDKRYTLWHSRNNDSLGKLLLEFMDYYSRTKNYKRISIIPEYSKLVNCTKEEWYDDPVCIQDPIITQKNIASGCKYHPLQNIAKTFASAVSKLKQGSSFQEVCNTEQ